MEIPGPYTYFGDERKRLQNRMAQRRHRQKVKALQSNTIVPEGDSSTGTSSAFQLNPSSKVKRAQSATGLKTATTGCFPDNSFALVDVFSALPANGDPRAHFTPGGNSPPITFSATGTSWELIDQAAVLSSSTESVSGTSAKDASDVEQGLEKVMDSIFNSGFDSMEAMVVAYYTLDFDESSTIGQAQRLSRKRHIRSLISALSQSSRNWSNEEACPFREEILKFAEVLYGADVQQMRSFHGLNISSPDKLLEDLLSPLEGDIETFLNGDLHRKVVQMPEIWSLFTRLVQQLGILPSMTKKAVS
ncbi:hypothetical protein DL767_003870 [Monosporascus sp. MG133]|nr:hypothetical protein DL767_003870 [Monosporascus sp. MG133]